MKVILYQYVGLAKIFREIIIFNEGYQLFSICAWLKVIFSFCSTCPRPPDGATNSEIKILRLDHFAGAIFNFKVKFKKLN